MRTTVNIDDALLRQAGSSNGRETPSVELATYGGSGRVPGVDLEDKDALTELLESDGSDRAAG